ncbi:MAG: hypothetical protein ACD_42C00476G0003 [uncultured bacterium]|nr:MAG: hypothetical protein ACD_42C00476G0003 [uncultured bacterium]
MFYIIASLGIIIAIAFGIVVSLKADKNCD